MVTVHATVNKKQTNGTYVHRDSSCNRKMVTIHATADMNQISFHATMSVHSTGNDDQFSIKR